MPTTTQHPYTTDQPSDHPESSAARHGAWVWRLVPMLLPAILVDCRAASASPTLLVALILLFSIMAALVVVRVAHSLLARCSPGLLAVGCGVGLLLSANAACGQGRSAPALFLGNEALPPMCFMEHGQPRGVVVDVAAALAQHMRRPVVVRLADWADAQRRVREGRAEALLQINPSPERRALYDFSAPLLRSEFMIFTGADRLGVAGLRDLRGLRVGVERTGLPIQLLQAHPEIITTPVPNPAQGFALLAKGAVDAVIADRWVGAYLLARDRIGGVRMIQEPVARSESAIAVRKGDTALLADINAALASLRQSGEYAAILDRWQPKEVVFTTREQQQLQAWVTAGIGALLLAALVSLALLVREVRRRRRVEAALRESVARQLLFIEHAPAALAMFDREMRYLAASQRWLQYFGLVGRDLCGVSHYEVFPEIGATWKAVHTRGLAGEVVREEEDPFVRQDGSTQWLMWEVRPWYDATGAVGGIIIFTEDITARKQAEEELRASEARYKTLYDSLPLSTVVFQQVGSETILTEYNQASLAFTGNKASEFVGTSIQEIYQHYPDILALIERTFASHRTHTLIKPYRKISTGEDIFLNLTVAYAPPDRVIMHSEDITARTQAEEALQESERRERERAEELAVLLDSAPTPVFIAHDAACHHLSGNRAAEALLRQPHGTETSLSAPDDVRPHHFRAIKDGRELSLDELPAQRAARGEQVKDFEFSLVFDDGLIRHVLGYGTPLLDEQGQPRGAVHVLVDITERKQAEDALRESEDCYHRLFDNMTDGFLLAELIQDAAGKPVDFRILEANRAYESILGCPREDAIGRTLLEIFPGLPPERFAAHVSVAQTGEPLRWQGLFKPTGRYYECFYYAPRPGQLAGIFTDITERKQAEEALQASLREKEVLLKEIHHRVKNNMQVISSLVSLQSDTLDDPTLRAVFNDLRDQVRTMALVHEKLYQSASLAHIDFAEYTQSLLAYLWRAHGTAATTIRLTLELEPVSVSIEQAVPCGLILNELVTNVLKHAFRNRVDGEVTVTLHADPQGHVCLGVRDNGVGLPADWRQAPSLGLQLVQMLTRQVSGTLDVRTEGGTAFTLTFAQPASVPNGEAQHA